MKAVKTLSLLTFAALFVLPVVTGCASMPKVHSAVEQILVFEDQVQSEAANLRMIADVAIATLPPEKQLDAREKLSVVYARLTELLAAKDKVVKAALDASSETIDLGTIAGDIVSAIQDIISLVRVFGAKPELVNAAEARAMSLSIEVSK